MLAVAQQRCLNHVTREAVARCPECRQFYCRECITEHDDRVICAACLRKLRAVAAPVRRSFAWAWPLVQSAIGFALVWLFFYFVGVMLLSVPSSFHEGTVWVDKWWTGR